MQRIPYQLRHPIETIVGDERSTITELQLAPRVKGRHMRATDKANGPVEAKLLLISSLAGITRAEADEMDEADILAVDALYGEPSDLSRVAAAIGLSPDTPIAPVLAAIADLKRSNLAVPLDGGAGRSADGPTTGAGSSAT